MNLLIDLGNTALKWATSDNPESPHTLVHGGSHHFSEKLLQALKDQSINHVYGCSVASRDLTLSVTRLLASQGVKVTWLKAQSRFDGQFSLVNSYKTAVQLGSDRWHAAIGAVSFLPGQALLVVHLGTASTVDCVFPQGNQMVFAGGRIAPGMVLMRDSLVTGTATLPKADGDYADFPTDTMTGIVTGIIDSQLGLIERGMRVMQQHGFEPNLVLAGGAVSRFAPYLQKEFPNSIIKHNLVLRGLALRSESEDRSMRTVAILLCLICAGYYGWEAFEGWLVEPQKPVQKSSAQAEVFPSAMQHIVPIDDLENYVKQERLAASEEKKALEEKQREAEELAKQEKQLAEAKKAEPLPIPIPQPQKETGITEETVCFRMGPLSTKALPSINRSIEKAGLLETVRVESVLSADSYVIFIIPTTTLKGAEALMKQVKKQGYPSARVIESGPLMNAVQLGEFGDPDRAQTFFEEALNKLKMNDIRLTRLIGEPSGKVHLIFSSLSEQQTRALKNVAQKHGQHLYNCQF